MLEPKERMKARGLPSPDRGDALALTFAYPVFPKSLTPVNDVAEGMDWDPYARD